MAKSLGDFNMERSSSSDLKNIAWTKKTPADPERTKKKTSEKSKNTSPTNIVYADADEAVSEKKTFVISPAADANRARGKNHDRRFENSSASNCKIQQGFKRPSR